MIEIRSVVMGKQNARDAALPGSRPVRAAHSALLSDSKISDGLEL
jgi:hypothetical protein